MDLHKWRIQYMLVMAHHERLNTTSAKLSASDLWCPELIPNQLVLGRLNFDTDTQSVESLESLDPRRHLTQRESPTLCRQAMISY